MEDVRGLTLSTGEPRAAALYNDAVAMLLEYRLATMPTVKEALAADPGFVMGHCLQGYLFMMFGTLSADELAMFEIMKSSAAMEQAGEAAEMFQLPKEFKLGSREKLNFQFWLSPAAGITKTLMDDKVEKDARTVSLDNLPADFKALIEQRKKAIMDSPFGKMMGGIGG